MLWPQLDCRSGQTSSPTIAQNASEFANSPAGQKLEGDLVTAAENSVVDVGVQYATTGKVDPRQIVGAAIYGSEAELRTVPPAQANSAVAVSTAVAQ